MAVSPELYERRVANVANARKALAKKVALAKRSEAIEFIKSVSDSLPPLTEAQRLDLAALLRGAEGDAA